MSFYHIIELDRLQEEAKGDNKLVLQSRNRSIYMDKAARVGIRIADLLDKEFS